jgi:hypothetical protein
MPGSISDSYDPEWGTSGVASQIGELLQQMHTQVSVVLDNRSPMDIRRLANADLPKPITATLTELEWRLLRFACERARESL